VPKISETLFLFQLEGKPNLDVRETIVKSPTFVAVNNAEQTVAGVSNIRRLSRARG
jgi:hypothetical protein